jgi:hypothetical protein
MPISRKLHVLYESENVFKSTYFLILRPLVKSARRSVPEIVAKTQIVIFVMDKLGN